MAKQKINQQQSFGQVYAYGSIGGNTGAQYKDLNVTSYVGLDKPNTTTLTVTVKGIYFIHMQQLVTVGASNGYLSIQKNNVNATHAYLIANRQIDMVVSHMGEFNVGDTIRLYQSVAITSAWSGEHSAIQIFLVKRTD